MFNIDDPSAALVRPQRPAAGNPGWFQPGNPATAAPGTRVRFYWLNTIQAEALAILSAAGLSPDPNNDGQLVAAIAILIGRAAGFTNGSNINGHYRIAPDGQIEQWGIYAQPTDGSGFNNIRVTFPIPFPSGVAPTGIHVTTANTTATSNGGSFSGQSATGMNIALNAALSFAWSARGT